MDNGESSYRRFLDGDDEGLLRVIDEYKTGLTLYINGIVGNLHLAEELTVDTFTRLAVKKPRFNGEAAFRTWLFAIGKNLAFDALKKRREVVPLEEIENYASDGEGPEEIYLRTERNRLIRRKLEKLKAEHKSAVWLVYFEGFSVAEAARIMRMSRRSFTCLLYRAKQALKTQLEKDVNAKELLDI